MSPIIRGFYAKNDLLLKASYECLRHHVPLYHALSKDFAAFKFCLSPLGNTLQLYECTLECRLEVMQPLEECVAACCSVLQRVAACCSVLLSRCCFFIESFRQHPATLGVHTSGMEPVEECVAACCSVLQCIAPPLLLFHTVVYYITVQTCDLTSAL